MILQPSPTCSSEFLYIKESSSFVAEISELGPNFSYNRVYDDACDIGFTMVSNRTGKKAVFALDKYNVDRENELISWIFKCVTPNLTYLKAEIFND